MEGSSARLVSAQSVSRHSVSAVVEAAGREGLAWVTAADRIDAEVFERLFPCRGNHESVYTQRLHGYLGDVPSSEFVESFYAGVEDGLLMMAGSCIIDPQGQIVARASTDGDELATAHIVLGQVAAGREQRNFYGRWRPEAYSALTEPHHPETAPL